MEEIKHLGNELTALGKLFEPTRLYPIVDGSVIIKESQEATLNKLHIAGIGANAIALRFDKLGHSTPFANGHGVRRACDVILFCNFINKGYILCIELKSGLPSYKDYTTQLLSAQCFIDYTMSILRYFHSLDCSHWERRFFVFHDAGKNPIAKESKKFYSINNNPNSPWLYPVDNGERIYLRKLLRLPL